MPRDIISAAGPRPAETIRTPLIGDTTAAATYAVGDAAITGERS